MRRIAICLLLFSRLSLPAVSQTKPGISGIVRHVEGAVIANARVLVHWDPAGSKVGLTDKIGIDSDVSVMTDTNGGYSATVPASFYDVFVSAAAFSPAAKVRVKKDKPGTFSPR